MGTSPSDMSAGLRRRVELFLDLSRKHFGFQCTAKMISDRFDAAALDYPDLNLIVGVDKPAQDQSGIFYDLCFNDFSREGFPLVIMEAMELGIPVISTKLEAYRNM